MQVKILLAVALIVGTGIAQAPPLQITHSLNPGGGFLVVATNVYTQPAIDYLFMGMGHYPTGTRCVKEDLDPAVGLCFFHSTRRYSALPPGNAGDVLPPGASKSLVLPLTTDFVSGDSGVIYANGETGGNPDVVRQLLRERQFHYNDIRQDIRLLGGGDPTAPINAAEVIKKLQNHIRRHPVAMRPIEKETAANGWYFPGRGADPICQLSLYAVQEGDPQFRQRIVAQLETWALQYSRSLPPLQ